MGTSALGTEGVADSAGGEGEEDTSTGAGGGGGVGREIESGLATCCGSPFDSHHAERRKCCSLPAIESRGEISLLNSAENTEGVVNPAVLNAGRLGSRCRGLGGG